MCLVWEGERSGHADSLSLGLGHVLRSLLGVCLWADRPDEGIHLMHSGNAAAPLDPMTGCWGQSDWVTTVAIRFGVACGETSPSIPTPVR